MTPVPAPTPAEVRYRRMAVDVETTHPDAVLERRIAVKESRGAFLVIPTRSEESTWEQVCVAPCRGADLDRYSTYRVAAANRISASRPFTLPQGGDHLHLRLDTGNLFAHRAGKAMAGLGGTALIVGLSLLVAAPNIVDVDREHDMRVAGWITAGSGLALFAVGLPLAILTKTDVYADSDRRVAAPAPRPRFTGNGFTF
jgi:hypothetical protein